MLFRSILVSSRTYFVATSAATNQHALNAVNHAINLSFRIVLVIVILQLLIDAWKLYRPTLPSKSLAF